MRQKAPFSLSLKNLIYRLRKFEPVLQENLRDIILEHKKKFADSVRMQLEEGYNGNNVPIASYRPYKKRTIRRKLDEGKSTVRVTLKDTGKFHRSLHLEARHDGFYIVSDDKEGKVRHLIKKYRPEILKVSNENVKQILDKYVKPRLVKKLKAYLSYQAFKKDFYGTEFYE